MKNINSIIAIIASLVLAATITSALAKDEEVTLKGEAKCAKCALKEGASCQSVIQVQEHGKTINYYVAANKVGKEFHKNVCQDSKKVTATGAVKTVESKREVTLAKIEVTQ